MAYSFLEGQSFFFFFIEKDTYSRKRLPLWVYRCLTIFILYEIFFNVVLKNNAVIGDTRKLSFSDLGLATFVYQLKIKNGAIALKMVCYLKYQGKSNILQDGS